MEKSFKHAGAPIPLILGLVFVVLKLTGNIDWSWWWVLSPFWICALFWLLLVAVLGIIVARTTWKNSWK